MDQLIILIRKTANSCEISELYQRHVANDIYDKWISDPATVCARMYSGARISSFELGDQRTLSSDDLRVSAIEGVPELEEKENV